MCSTLTHRSHGYHGIEAEMKEGMPATSLNTTRSTLKKLPYQQIPDIGTSVGPPLDSAGTLGAYLRLSAESLGRNIVCGLTCDHVIFTEERYSEGLSYLHLDTHETNNLNNRI
jgi:hypothetical protein